MTQIIMGGGGGRCLWTLLERQ